VLNCMLFYVDGPDLKRIERCMGSWLHFKYYWITESDKRSTNVTSRFTGSRRSLPQGCPARSCSKVPACGEPRLL
jgi:hypothetical protein